MWCGSVCVHTTARGTNGRERRGSGREGRACGTCATPGRLFPRIMYCTLGEAIWLGQHPHPLPSRYGTGVLEPLARDLRVGPPSQPPSAATN